MSVDTGAGPGRYWAFISYSHKDAAFGRRLHRRLEAYALPRRLVGRARADGMTVPRHLAPIFRDREEFSAAQDLSAEVRAALAQSRSLVVVCSAAAAQSAWVAREIALFRELHPDRAVLAAIRAGEPSDGLPPVLRQRTASGEAVEPLAADFRKGRDGWEHGLLKLVAGIVGVGLDELVQRDSQRRVRRVTAVTAAALTLVLVMGVLTVFAFERPVRSRAPARRSPGVGQVHAHRSARRVEGGSAERTCWPRSMCVLSNTMIRNPASSLPRCLLSDRRFCRRSARTTKTTTSPMLRVPCFRKPGARQMRCSMQIIIIPNGS